MATNESYRDMAISRGNLRPDSIFVVRNGPDLQSFRPVSPNPERKHGKRYLVGYVGNMNFQDGLDILIGVAKHVKDMGRSDVHFTCVGRGPELKNLRQMVQQMGLEDTIDFTGRVSDRDLIEILSTADVCVNPDRPSEMNDLSTMIKIMEYMALGKPIVQFDSKEGRFSAQEASLYAGKNDGVADFAAKVVWLLDRPEERKKMGELGRKRIEEQLAWEYSVPQLLAAYQKAFDGSH
jgi:glycosyltransferase involved in cell wall biosynthesis